MATASGSGSARTRQCARSEAGTVPVCAETVLTKKAVVGCSANAFPSIHAPRHAPPRCAASTADNCCAMTESTPSGRHPIRSKQPHAPEWQSPASIDVTVAYVTWRRTGQRRRGRGRGRAQCARSSAAARP
jgi:hypothetical protein